jgi:glycine/D-amino acid oxidase-like deaminating enzyme
MPEIIPDDLVSQTWTRKLEPPASLPASADVVIIGAGIVGISTAWFLARQGINVAVCDKGHVAGEQSGRNWGWVRQQGRDSREMPMIVESLRIWRKLADEIGEDVGFSEQGILYAIANDQQAERYAAWAKSVEDYDIGTRLIDGKKLKELVRGSTTQWQGALYTAGDGRAEPHKATPAIARAAMREGASVLTSCAVRGIESSGGRVSAVVTEHGKIKTSIVLCAAGAWTSMFCRSLGISVPQLKVRGTVARTAPAESVCEGSLFDNQIAIRRRQDGGYSIAHGLFFDHQITPSTIRFSLKFLPALLMDHESIRLFVGREFFEELSTPATWSLDAISPFEKCRVLNPPPNAKILRNIRASLDREFPSLAGTPIVETWGGTIEMTPDLIPVIDEANALPGFFIATGFSGHGFGIGPGAGKAIAGLLSGNDSGIDLNAFRLSRFFDGTPIRPQTSV